MDSNFLHLIRYIEEQTAFRCQSYKTRPLRRRIKVRMRALGLTEYFAYYQYLQNNPEELKNLLDALTINLSYFFRNRETFDYLRKEILPEFMRYSDTYTFWSAGCAQGEEAYTLAIIAAESAILDRTVIYGTDIDTNALQIADKGVYTSMALQYTPADVIDKYFDRVDRGFLIRKEIRSCVKFMNLDLFERPDFHQCDLLMCRNVLIYLDRNGQSLVLKNFYDQLKPGGYLVIGKVELLIGIPEADRFEVVSRSEHVYRKITM